MVAVQGRPQRPTVRIERVLRPFREFAHLEASGGVVLLAATILALAWANSPWAGAYEALWHTPVTVGVGPFVLAMDLHHWINDGLMALFFFVVGLEIKRELQVGELASVRRAALPIAAAAGGMLVPAAIYALVAGSTAPSGWGIPMATDIAFALGVLALLGRRVPLGLKVFLAALAVVDDIGAVLVIAIFYTPDVSWPHLGASAGIVLLLMGANWSDIRGPGVYAVLGVALWLAVLLSGVHATVAGVLLAMTIPARSRIDPDLFVAQSRAYLDEFQAADVDGSSGEGQQAAVQALEEACEQVQTPLQRLEHELHPWVAFAVMPVFALANAGISLDVDWGGALTNPVTLGVALGLVVGKQVGITAFSWLASRLGVGALPEGVTWWHVYGAAWIGGIGFTMSLFIGGLAFAEAEQLAAAKMGILGGSLVAGTVGWLLLRARPVSAAADGVGVSETPAAATAG